MNVFDSNVLKLNGSALTCPEKIKPAEQQKQKTNKLMFMGLLEKTVLIKLVLEHWQMSSFIIIGIDLVSTSPVP